MVKLMTDVLIVGGGPTGLLLSYYLLRVGIKVINIEQYDKEEQAMYGRACMLYVRSLEILDQMDLFDPLAEIGYIIRDAVSYRGTTELPDRGWSTILNAVKGKSYLDFSLSVRQKIIEEVFRERIRSLDSSAFRSPARLVAYTVDNTTEYPIEANVEENGEEKTVKCKYLVGADGGKSTVRRLANIPFPGATSPFKWIRLDAIVECDMPAYRRGGVAIESPTHGSVLWIPTDNGRTRIGFVCFDEVFDRGVTAEIVMTEAKKAVQPFKLEFAKLDWWTVYAIGQRLAETFQKGPIFLAGDAAHTHSSGAAQGMNTGFHDASNLGWKLAGVLKGWFDESILETYNSERRVSVQKLIQLDKDVASLISGVIPDHYGAAAGADVHDYLNRAFEENAAFTVGLGISYESNLVNEPPLSSAKLCELLVGHRLPDVLLYRPGVNVPKRLYEFMPNTGAFYALVFAGELNPNSYLPRLKQENLNRLNGFRSFIEGQRRRNDMFGDKVKFLTILKGSNAVQSIETLGGPPIGKVLYDLQGHQCYDPYGIGDESNGIVVVVRPDGIVSFIMPLDQPEALVKYLGRFIKSGSNGPYDCVVDVSKQGGTVGEISIEDKM